MMADTMKTYWIISQAVRAVIPVATVGLEEIEDTSRVVSDRNSVTSKDILPGMI